MGFGGDLPPDRPLGASDARVGVQMDTDGACRLNCSSPSHLNSGLSDTLLPRAVEGPGLKQCNELLNDYEMLLVLSSALLVAGALFMPAWISLAACILS